MAAPPELGKFISAQKVAREERALEKRKEQAAVLLQSAIRGYIARKSYRRRVFEDFDHLLGDSDDLKPNVAVFMVASRFLSLVNVAEDNQRLEKLCKYLLKSVETSDSPKFSYIGVALNKEYSLAWIRHIKIFLGKCCDALELLKPESHLDSVSLALQLHTLIAFTSPNSWALLKANKQLTKLMAGMNQMCANIMGALVKRGFFGTLKSVLFKGICRNNVSLKPVSLIAILSLATRPLVSGGFTENLLTQFIINLLTVPALIYQVEALTPDFMTKLTEMDLLFKCIQLLSDDSAMKTLVTSIQGTQILALLANIIHLFNGEPLAKATEQSFPNFTFVITKLLQSIPPTVGPKGGSFSQWHELLGWYTPAADAPSTEGNLNLIKRQVHLLWNHRQVKILLGDNLKELVADYEKYEILMPPASSSTGGAGGSSTASNLNTIIKRALDRSTPKQQYYYPNHKTWRKLGSGEVAKVSLIATMYYSALTTLSQLKLDILSGICYSDRILHDLYLLITSLGPHCGLKGFLELLQVGSGSTAVGYAPPLLLLQLFCDCMTHYVTILDDIEMYEQQTPFHLNDFIALSYFLNNFLYKGIQENIFDPKTVTTSPLFQSMHTLALCLYRRDCRRQFAPVNHWLVHELKPSHFLSDLEKGKKHTQILLQKMPHIIPHEDRVKLFRKFVLNEKAVLGLTDSVHNSVGSSALITIHRDRIVEDGYRQLAALPAHALKGVIRVRFINQQGLDEAGIDQDGVFKEFLEETIKRVFDPSLNLFKTTTDQRLYPSPTSHLQENHLFLFEFVGRMLGKAVYEGIVVDVPFASFFLSQLLGQTQQALYSCMDELPSLDKELYRSLTFIKHYEGDVADLDLTFSVDEDVMGRIVSHELVDGGRIRPVTNDNKINYIHYMAFFRMHTQIKEQSIAFLRGFRSIVNPDWLSLFSTPELQRLVSGDTAPFDLRDLRKHTQYYGGFHDAHRVVGWLWDILAKDFTEEERGLFLKFVTSCSKPPLLGFAHLEPPFSIRCVEVGDDEDTGDTIGSVIRGFFTIRRKDPLNRRLPTTSTCFNLLKLPNYQKKSILRDKLRYAVCSNTGFELS